MTCVLSLAQYGASAPISMGALKGNSSCERGHKEILSIKAGKL